MKKFFKFVFLLIVLVIISLVGYFAYLGGFSSVNVQPTQTGGELIAYEKRTGPYVLSGEVMERLYNELLAEGVQTTKGIGLYYDNPEQVDPTKLRFEAGEIIENISPEKQTELSAKYQLKTLPKGEYLVVTVPYKGMPSIIVGIMKAYPALTKYMDENNLDPVLPAQEIYDMEAETITYRLQATKKP